MAIPAPLKILLLTASPSAAAYIGFAKNKHKQLTSLRKRTNLPLLSSKYTLHDGVVATVFSSDFANYVRISGGAPGLDFVFFTASESYLFLTTSGSLRSTTDVLFSEQISQIHRDAIVDSPGTVAQHRGGQLRKKTNVGTKVAGTVNGFGVLATSSEMSLTTKQLTDPVPLVQLPSEVQAVDAVFERRSQSALQFSRGADIWNGLQVPELWTIPLSNPPGAVATHDWTPHIWHSEPYSLWSGGASATGFTDGLYYGHPFDNSKYELGGPFREVHCLFGSYLVDYAGNALIGNFGYSEILSYTRSSSGEEVYLNKVFLYMDTKFKATTDVAVDVLYVKPYYDIRKAYNIDQDFMPLATLVVEMGGKAEETKTALWSCVMDTENDEYVHVGFVCYNKNDCKVYRIYCSSFFGAIGYNAQLIYEGTYANDVSIRNDGKFVTIHRDEEIVVIDLIKKSNKAFTVPAFIDGEFLPFKPEDSNAYVVPDGDALPSATSIDDLDNVNRRAFRFGTVYRDPIQRSFTLGAWKILAKKELVGGEERYVGYGRILDDDCFESKMTVIRPEDYSKEQRPHSVFVDGVEYTAESFGGLVTSAPKTGYFASDQRFWTEIAMPKWDQSTDLIIPNTGVVAGKNTVVELIEFTADFIHHDSYSRVWKPDNFTGEIQWENAEWRDWNGGAQLAGYYMDPYKANCDGTVTVTATDECNHKKEKLMYGFTPSVGWPFPHRIDNNDFISILGPNANLSGQCGATYSVTDRIFHTWKFDNLSGCCGMIRITANYDCDKSETVDFALPQGIWVETDSGTEYPDREGLPCPHGAPCYAGDNEFMIDGCDGTTSVINGISLGTGTCFSGTIRNITEDTEACQPVRNAPISVVPYQGGCGGVTTNPHLAYWSQWSVRSWECP